MSRRPLWHHLAASAAALAMLFYAFVLGRRVPLLGYADLGFHELGHLLAGMFGRTFSFLMGSGTQVLVPAGLAVYFWVKSRDRLATGLMLVWAATSMQDASVYIADAPYQRLPLIGGHHDWAYLLGHWGIVDRAPDVAGTVLSFGVVAGVVGLAMIAALPTRALWARAEDRWRRFRARDLPVRKVRSSAARNEFEADPSRYR